MYGDYSRPDTGYPAQEDLQLTNQEMIRHPARGKRRLGMDAGSGRIGSTSNAPETDKVTLDELDRQLERILASRLFAKSRRLQDFLRYSVERIKTGQGEPMKEYVLAVEVFGRKPSFDPR